MEVIHKMISLEIESPVSVDMPQAVNLAIAPQYPYGTQLCLNDMLLERLGLDDDCDVGDTLHFHAMAKVTSKSKNEQSGTRIELQITEMSAEDEDKENEDDEEAEDAVSQMKKRGFNPYK